MIMQTSDQIFKTATVIEELVHDNNAVRTLTSPAGKALAREFDLAFSALVAAFTYSMPERHRIVKQLQLVLGGFYVHFERKKSIYGFDPLRALDLLAGTLETLSDGEFHQSIVQIITRTRDRHLSFYGKSPFGLSASLGFMIERCCDGDQAQYVVTKIKSDLMPKQLRVGAFVTHWNGIPIERFIRLNANILDGGNEAASRARSLLFLTERPLGRFGPPLEEWVDLRFGLSGAIYEERFVWKGFDATQAPLTPSLGRNLTGFGGDLDLFHLHHARRVQFAPESFDTLATPKIGVAEHGVPQIIGRVLNGQLEYGSVTTEHGTFAYIRLRAFQVDNVDDILDSFISVLRQLPRNGLILDMRENSGGYIAAGERVLQLFTSQRITPTRFQFRVTPATRVMARNTDLFRTWNKSFDEAFGTGEPYTQGYPIEGADDDANKVGQQYFGPVVVVTDALAFSTADMFVAGFVDHEIGRLICLDRNIAAAGGNNWYWPVFRLLNPDFRLDQNFRPSFESGVLSPEIHEAFNSERASLSDKATLSQGRPEYDGVVWRISDDTLVHSVRHVPWLDSSLLVYLDESRLGLADMPAGVTVSFTARRCLRTRKSEGKLLEDLGVEPDVVYQMTFRDITERNQDLMIRACLELTRMPAYDLDIQIVQTQDGHDLLCRTLNLTSLEVYVDQAYLTGSPASDIVPTKIGVKAGLTTLIVNGLKENSVVARTTISLPA
jgi:Peptidase family S41